jgi:hypothetical protein
MSQRTVEAALQEFFGGFGLPAYPDQSPLQPRTLPYLVYTPVRGCFGGGSVDMTATIWDRPGDPDRLSDLTQGLLETLAQGGAALNCQDGLIWLTPGSPLVTPVVDQDDGTLQGRRVKIRGQFYLEG